MFGHASQGCVVNAHKSLLMQQQTVHAMVLLAAKLGNRSIAGSSASLALDIQVDTPSLLQQAVLRT